MAQGNEDPKKGPYTVGIMMVVGLMGFSMMYTRCGNRGEPPPETPPQPALAALPVDAAVNAPSVLPPPSAMPTFAGVPMTLGVLGQEPAPFGRLREVTVDSSRANIIALAGESRELTKADIDANQAAFGAYLDTKIEKIIASQSNQELSAAELALALAKRPEATPLGLYVATGIEGLSARLPDGEATWPLTLTVSREQSALLEAAWAGSWTHLPPGIGSVPKRWIGSTWRASLDPTSSDAMALTIRPVAAVEDVALATLGLMRTDVAGAFPWKLTPRADKRAAEALPAEAAALTAELPATRQCDQPSLLDLDRVPNRRARLTLCVDDEDRRSSMFAALERVYGRAEPVRTDDGRVSLRFPKPADLAITVITAAGTRSPEPIVLEITRR